MEDRDALSLQLSWSAIVSDEHRRHPHMTGRDVHKLVVQACLGGDHLLRNPAMFREDLEKEWALLEAHGQSNSMPALQIIHPAGIVARLHLGACRSMGISKDEVQPVLLGQPMRDGSLDAVVWAWAPILHDSRISEIAFSFNELSSVDPTQPISTHSPSYGPASYRIINDLRHGPTRQALRALALL